ncbi:MAG: aspartate carbamoyltransferase regulatory subunit [Eubacteriales bacterium]|nr:aspartate carbamoyltransferase regulatory subunit [Eubacteriales bacterium]MDD3198743.1 aspartate carbamoyltransferase regulatory subunit [Eubacteriales bacterium]MDD4629011.1 aspartate carbamoyltransferase regulatory subunit [Eubacteriales bacterium]
MVVIDSIKNGIVIDHITAGLGMKLLEYLDIDTSQNTVALIMNAVSNKYGRKDVVKIENVFDIDLAALGIIDPKATVNYIEDHVINEKIHLTIPERVVNIIKCNNPRCVTSIEAAAPQIFHLIDRENREYRCEYCDEIISMKGGYGNEIIHRQWFNR